MRIPAADRLVAVIGYLPFLFFLPVRFRRQSLFCQFHGRQSGVLFGLWFLVVAICLGALLFAGSGGLLVDVLFYIAYVVTGIYLLMMLIGILKVMLGERYRMPVVADIALALRL